MNRCCVCETVTQAKQAARPSVGSFFFGDINAHGATECVRGARSYSRPFLFFPLIPFAPFWFFFDRKLIFFFLFFSA